MIEKVKKIMLDICNKSDWKWEKHVLSVVEKSKELAKKVGADEEIVEISAWLHDIKKIQGESDLHHVKGAEEAEKILKDLDYPKDKIEKVKHCITTHSSDKNYMPESIEAKVLASGDALAHFDSFIWFTRILFFDKKMSVDDAREWIIGKYANSWEKMIPEAKEMAKEKYDAIKLLLNKQKNL